MVRVNAAATAPRCPPTPRRPYTPRGRRIISSLASTPPLLPTRRHRARHRPQATGHPRFFLCPHPTALGASCYAGSKSPVTSQQSPVTSHQSPVNVHLLSRVSSARQARRCSWQPGRALCSSPAVPGCQTERPHATRLYHTPHASFVSSAVQRRTGQGRQCVVMCVVWCGALLYVRRWVLDAAFCVAYSAQAPPGALPFPLRCNACVRACVRSNGQPAWLRRADDQLAGRECLGAYAVCCAWALSHDALAAPRPARGGGQRGWCGEARVLTGYS